MSIVAPPNPIYLTEVGQNRYTVRDYKVLEGIVIERDHGFGGWRIQRETLVMLDEGIKGYKRTVLGYENTLPEVKRLLSQYINYCEEE